MTSDQPYNRDYLEFLIKRDLKKNSRKRAVIGINLSTLQRLMINYGLHYTQNLIKDAAGALRKFCTKYRLLFHAYENCFVFYINEYKNQNELHEFGAKIADTLSSLFLTERIGGGIGILEITENEDGFEMDLMMKRLLIASEKSASLLGKDFGICFYNEALENAVNRKRTSGTRSPALPPVRKATNCICNINHHRPEYKFNRAALRCWRG